MTIEELKELKKECEQVFSSMTAEIDSRIAELEKSKQISRRWKPENKEEYYYIADNGEIALSHWTNYLTDNTRYAIGNCFKTEEEAEFMVERLKVLAEMREYADDEQEWEYDNCHWHIGYNPNTECIKVGYFIFTKNIPFNIYFSSEEQAQKAIDAIGEERLKKYYFEVEE